MGEEHFKNVMITVIFLVLVVLSFLLLKPILLSIIIGIILAVLLLPVHRYLTKFVHSRNLSVILICSLLILLIILPFWFLTPTLVKQSFKIYLATQEMDFVTPLKNIFPSLFASEEFSAEIGSILHSFTTRATNSFMNSLSNLIINFPTILLQSFVVFFTLFFVLRDNEKILSYFRSLLPFSKTIEDKLFESSKAITSSVIYGQVFIGIIQGLIAGLGFFIFKVPNALFLTLLACIAGILPVVGTTVIWVPVLIYFIIGGNTVPALGVAIFGFIASSIDNIIRPIFVSKRTDIHPLLILMGMIGGLFLFGILGFIIGPLIIAYILIFLEIYRDKKIPGFFI